MAKKNEKKEKSIGDKVLKSVNDFAKRTLFIPSLVFDRIYSDVTGKPTDYNKALYASIDPTGQRPDFSINGVAEAIANTYKFLKKYYDRDFENIDYIKDTENIPLQNRVAIAAWAKYNKLPYDESLIIDNGDGTYSLPKEIEKSMRKDRSDIEKVYKINKKNYDKRRGDYEKRLDIARSNNDMSDYNKVRSEMEQDDELFYLKTAVNMDKKNMEAMDSLMAGKPSVFNEFNYKNRNIRNIEENKGMLNVLGNHTLYKRDDGRVGYRDIYDLNQPFDFLLGGAPFYIRGVAGGIHSDFIKKKKDGGNVRKNQDYIYNRLVNEYGFAPVQAVAIVANLTHESGLTDDILGDNGASYGLQQWKGSRRKNLFSFAKGKGHSKPTIDDQIDFLVHEYKNNQAFQFKNKGQNLYQTGKVNNDIFDYFQYSKADFDNAESLWDATIAWNQGVGRPNKKYAFNDRRFDIAVELANRYGVEYGKERKYTDMGYSDMVQQEPVNTGDKKQDYYENYGKQILVNVLPAQTPSTVQSVSSSETNVEKKLDEDEEYNAEQIEAMRQEQEMEKRRALVAAFLPNIQLKIKGTSKTAN